MKQTQPTRIILADDHIAVRDALAISINMSPYFQVVGKAANGIELLEIMKTSELPDIILLDLQMPLMDGFEVASYFQQRYPSIKILIFTMYNSEITLLRLLQMGVRGFLKKDISTTELEIALQTVAGEGYYYSNEATGKLGVMLYNAKKDKTSIDKTLPTETEIEFLKLASTDMTYKEIAMVMNSSPRAVDTCRDTLFGKLNVKSRVGLAIFAIRNGIVEI